MVIGPAQSKFAIGCGSSSDSDVVIQDLLQRRPASRDEFYHRHIANQPSNNRGQIRELVELKQVHPLRYWQSACCCCRSAAWKAIEQESALFINNLEWSWAAPSQSNAG